MIKIEHLAKTYGKLELLRNINAEIHEGDVISLIGTSGSGKSTLLRCINALEIPDSGSVTINGINMFDPATDVCKVRQHIGMVFQNFNLFSHMMVIENVMMGPMDLLGLSKQEAYDEALRQLKAVGMSEKLYSYPDELSGGQQQRVAIARCLAMNPDLLLLDEPTAHLDPIMVREVQAVIKKLANEGLTMLVVSHDMNFSMEISNRVFFLSDGIIYEEGSPEQILTNPKREKTKAFIRGLQVLSYHISSKDFDIYELNARIEDFGEKREMSDLHIKSTQLVIEELLVNNLLKHSSNISIELLYDKDSRKAKLEFTYDGESFDPFNNDDEDYLSMLIVRQLANDVEFEYKVDATSKANNASNEQGVYSDSDVIDRTHTNTLRFNLLDKA